MSLVSRAFVVVFLVSIVSAVNAQRGSEERAVTPFSRLHVDNGIDVYLTQSDRQSVKVEGSDLGDLVTKVEDGELRITRKKGGSFWGGGRAYVDFVGLSAIEASGGSDIEGRNDFKLDSLSVKASGGSDLDFTVHAQRLDCAVSGGSDVKLEGSAKALTISASGGSDISARDLRADGVTLDLSGGSDATVNATESIEVEASGGSDVSVVGNPSRRTVNNDRSSDVYWR